MFIPLGERPTWKRESQNITYFSAGVLFDRLCVTIWNRVFHIRVTSPGSDEFPMAPLLVIVLTQYLSFLFITFHLFISIKARILVDIDVVWGIRCRRDADGLVANQQWPWNAWTIYLRMPWAREQYRLHYKVWVQMTSTFQLKIPWHRTLRKSSTAREFWYSCKRSNPLISSCGATHKQMSNE